MNGVKLLTDNLRAWGGFQYEFGKTYTIPRAEQWETRLLCSSGWYHFYDSIIKSILFNGGDDPHFQRLFRVATGGIHRTSILRLGVIEKVGCTRIRLVEELPIISQSMFEIVQTILRIKFFKYFSGCQQVVRAVKWPITLKKLDAVKVFGYTSRYTWPEMIARMFHSIYKNQDYLARCAFSDICFQWCKLGLPLSAFSRVLRRVCGDAWPKEYDTNYKYLYQGNCYEYS